MQVMDASASELVPMDLPAQPKTINLEVYDDTYAKEQVWYGRPYRSRYIYLGWDPYTKHMRTRPHLRYDLRTLDAQGISAGQIESAVLYLYNWRPINPEPFDVKIYPITQDWDHKQLEWNNQPSVGPTAITSTLNQRIGWEQFDITSIVKAQMKGDIPNYGIAIHKVLEYENGTWLCAIDGDTRMTVDGCTMATWPYVAVTTRAMRTIRPPNGKVEIIDHVVYLSWDKDQGKDTTYQVEYSHSDDFQAAILIESTNPSSEFHNLPKDELLYFRIRALDGDLISQWSTALMVTIPAPQPPPKPIPAPEAPGPTPAQQRPAPTLPKRETSPTLEAQTPESKVEVLGIKDKPEQIQPTKEIDCHFQYNIQQKDVKIVECDLPIPKIKADNHIKAEQEIHWISLTLAHKDLINTQIDLMSCKQLTWYDPRTWFWCVDTYLESETHIQELEYIYTANINKEILQSYPGIESSQILLQADKDFSGERVKVFANATFSQQLESGHWLDFNKLTDLSGEVVVPKAVSSLTLDGKPFHLPFDHNPGVTQWHGDTTYQSPHTGIDFGVSKENIYAIADGVVEAALWDSYYGSCKSGGNVLRIKQVNGMHSVYMHLSNYNDSDGVPLKKGDQVRAGELIGRTGNSGAWNCQSLGYHLHMEVRKGRYQSTHVDPVPYLSANWDAIPTLGASTYPARLTGDNPHPGR